MSPLIKLAIPAALVSVVAGAWVLSSDHGEAVSGSTEGFASPEAVAKPGPDSGITAERPSGMSDELGKIPAAPAVGSEPPSSSSASARQRPVALKLSRKLPKRAARSPVEPVDSLAVPNTIERSGGDSAAPILLTVPAPGEKLVETKSHTDGKTEASPGTTIAFGAGVDRFPRWLGASRTKTVPVPYININWRDRIEFSTVDGLIVDLIHGEHWHGGLVGTMMWGRSRSDLGSLANLVPTLGNTLQAGGYLEYAITKGLSVGGRVRHDIQPTNAAYGDLYVDIDLPAPEPVEHSLHLSVEAMNRAAMRRFFGVTVQTAGPLGVAAYQPGGGVSQLVVSYNAFIPTSEHTGVALAASVGQLARSAADSPLVRNFGTPYQKNAVAAFVYHF